MGSLAIDFSDRTVFVIENIKIPDYCSLFESGLSKTKTQFEMWSAPDTVVPFMLDTRFARLCGGE